MAADAPDAAAPDREWVQGGLRARRRALDVHLRIVGMPLLDPPIHAVDRATGETWCGEPVRIVLTGWPWPPPEGTACPDCSDWSLGWLDA